MKDNKIAEIHNEMRDMAVRCHAHGSLRLQIANILSPLVSELKSQREEIEILKIENDRLRSHRKAKRAFWSGFQCARCQPDDSDIQANWYRFLDKESG